MIAFLLFLIAAVCFGITLKQALTKVPYTHSKDDKCPKPEDPDGKGRHIDFYC